VLFAAARQAKDGKGGASYGLAFILASLTLSNDELRKEALAEKDISPEQYEQLAKIQKMQTVRALRTQSTYLFNQT
jgi:hypothetical protein